MNQPLFCMPTPSTPTGGLSAAAIAQVEYLTERGALTDAHGLTRALILHLAGRVEGARDYAAADLAKQLVALLGTLPDAADGDMWDVLSGLATRLTTPHHQIAPARYATAPTLGAAHQLESVAMVAAMLGTPLMPWQAQVARVATERHPTIDRWRYRRVIITVPRQSGKTTLLGALFVHRALTRKLTRAWMTAQTGRDATARWNDIRKAILHTPIGPFVSERLSAGSSALNFPRSDSHISPFPPTKSALHGYTVTDVSVDEAFAFDVAQGAELMAAVDPATSTIPDSQLWIISTAGDPESTWLKALVAEGRAAVDDPDAGTAYFEWSEDDDADDADLSHHPALGWTQTQDTLDDLRSRTPVSEWRRAFQNRWVDSSADPLIPDDVWQATIVADQPQPVPGRPLALAFDVAYDRSRSSIVAGWQTHDDGPIHVRIVKAQAGMDWVIPSLAALAEEFGEDVVLAADNAGPAVQLIESLTRDGANLKVLGTRDFTTGCGAFVHRATRHTLTTAPDTALAAAVKHATTRTLGEAWAVSRAKSAGPIDSLVAAIVAARVVDTSLGELDPMTVIV